MKKAIIFDFWDTIGTKNMSVSKTIREVFDLPKTENFLYHYEKAVQLRVWETEAEMARNCLIEFGLEQTPGNIQFLVETFRKAISGATLFDGMRELLTSLKEKGYKLGLLSNTTFFEAVVVKNLGIDQLFDALCFSWQRGNLKPSLEAYQQVLSELGMKREEVVFIDDTEKNIITAQSYGIESTKFESVTQLIAELQKLKIL